MTDAALASIVEVRQPIRPEFSPGGLVAVIPVMVIAALLVMLAIGGLLFISQQVLGPFGFAGIFNPWAHLFPSTPSNPFLPGLPLPRR